jgi:hypothetical protein
MPTLARHVIVSKVVLAIVDEDLLAGADIAQGAKHDHLPPAHELHVGPDVGLAAVVEEPRDPAVRVGAHARDPRNVKRVQVVRRLSVARRQQLAQVLAQVPALGDRRAPRLHVDAVAQVRVARVPDLEAFLRAPLGPPGPGEAARFIVAVLVELLAHEAQQLVLVPAQDPVDGRGPGRSRRPCASSTAPSSCTGKIPVVASPLGGIDNVIWDVHWLRRGPANAAPADSVLVPSPEGCVTRRVSWRCRRHC